MANFNNSTVTLAGRQMLATCIANGQSIEFTSIAVGDGDAPIAPENLTGLTHKLFEIGVSKVQDSTTTTGAVMISGSFKNQGTQGNFYLREMGAYARIEGSEGAPILFLYTNAGDTADYIPTVGVKSIIEQNIILSVPIGSATVLYVDDPTAAATWQDMQELEERVNDAIAEFGEERMAELDAQVKQLSAEMAAAAEQLEAAGEGFVIKGGDTMTGDLTMGSKPDGTSAKVIGDLDGSASKWEGWQLFSDIEEIGLTEGNTMLEIGQAMPSSSRLLHSTAGTTPISATGFPSLSGVLEIVKFSDLRCAYTFTDINGHRWHSAIHNLDPQWKGWIFSDGTPVGTLQMFAGSAAPYGYLLCQGQSVSKVTYAALFAVIGYTYGGEGDKFNLPDFRGMFPRGFDAGRGVDTGRVLGTSQQSGVPNISGTFPGVGQKYASHKYEVTGAMYTVNTYNQPTNGAKVNNDGQRDDVFGFDASRSSEVYQDGLTEVRPVNIAVNFIIKY